MSGNNQESDYFFFKAEVTIRDYKVTGVQTCALPIFAAELPTVGSKETREDATLAAQRSLAKHLTMSWTSRSKRGFFLRAEDFFGYAKRLSRMKTDRKSVV